MKGTKEGKIYYKVVRKTPKGFFSAIITGINGAVRYRVGRWAAPRIKGTRLLVFRDLVDAQYFLMSGANVTGPTGAIFLCEAEDPREERRLCACHQPSAFIRFWKEVATPCLKRKCGVLDAVFSPCGTFSAKRIKLLVPAERRRAARMRAEVHAAHPRA